MSTIYRTIDGDMVDDLCHRFYGRSDGTVEAVLEANPGLAALGPVLAAGVRIVLPDLPPATTKAVVRLWG